MKKTIAAILTIAILAIAIALPSFAAETIYFTSVNNILMPLSDDTMPINYKGTIYVPYSVFNSNELGTFAVYSQTAQIVTVFGNGVQLYFNLQEGTTYDTFDSYYRYEAVSSNGSIYLPASFTCKYFDISYSTIHDNKYGTIIRMTVGDALDDSTFSSAASHIMKSRLDDYNKAKATPTPTPTPVPTPAPTPVRTPAVTNPETPDYSNVNVYISFFGIDPELTPRILTILQPRFVPATFFVAGDDIIAHPDIIRRISASGHTIGLICGSDIASDYERASTLLFDAAHTSSFIIATDAEFTSSDIKEDTAGLIRYCSVSEAEPLESTHKLPNAASSIDRMDLIFTTDEQTASSLSTLIRNMRNLNFNISRLSELRAAEYGETE